MAALGARRPAEAAARRVESMVARHGPALIRVANQYSLCHDDALDAYQRALEIYLRRLDTVDAATEGAWMRVVVKHEAIAICRARQASVDREDTDLDLSVHDELREVDDAVAGGERVERSVEALKALKPDEARALLLKAEGLSYQEIGNRFGWTYTKVNRSITEGRRRFLRVFNGIEAGEACADYAPVLSALASGTATSAQVVSIRPHLRHCATCRAAVRDMRFSRRRRLALFLPLGWLARWDVNAGLQYAAAGGGGRLGPAVGLIGICLSGVGAGAACVVTGTLPPPPIIANIGADPKPEPANPARAERAKERRRAPAKAAAAATPVSTPAAAATVAPTTPATRKPQRSKPQRKKAKRRQEFAFEGTPSPAEAAASAPLAQAASTGGSSGAGGAQGGGGTRSSGGAAPAGGEFGFEGGG